jgi:hypothetical protein
MAKIKNFGVITRFPVKMYCNLRNLTTGVVLLDEINYVEIPEPGRRST